MATIISEEDYINILLEECYSRGLLGWLDHTTAAHVIEAIGPFKIWQTADLFHAQELDEESVDGAVLEQERRVRKLERRDLLETHYSTYGTAVQEHAYRRYLQLGGRSEEWLAIKQKFPNNTLLRWMAALWTREEQVKPWTTTQCTPGQKDERIRLIILGDVPQEPGYERDDGVWNMIVEPTNASFYINHNTSFTDFQESIADFPLIRYHITKHNPALASTLFAPDDDVYPPGLHASWDEEGNTIHPERFQKRADLFYDNGPGRGWWSGVINTSNQHGPVVVRSLDWRALDTEEDWKSLCQILRSGQGTTFAYLYHLSVRERIRFLKEQVDEEKRYMAENHGYKVFNFLLGRHRHEEKDGGLDSLCGAQKDCGKDCKDTGMDEA